MKKKKYLSFLLTVICTFFCLSMTVKATATCSYGVEYNGKWYKMLDIKINGYNDYEMSYQTAYYQYFIEHGIKKCNGSCSDKSIGGYKIQYYTEFSEEIDPDDLTTGSDFLDNIPLISSLAREIKVALEGGELSTLVTYTINLYATANAYSVIGEYDICPNIVYVYYATEANSYASQWFGDADHDNVISYFIFKDDITKVENDIKKIVGYSLDVDDDSTLYLLDCDGNTCEKAAKSTEYIEYSECATYNDYMYVLNHLKNENGGNCDDNDAFTEVYRELVSLCDNYSSSTTYTEENGETAKKCMTACTKLKDDVAELCDYENTSTTKQCSSFGERTLAWIFKIINMVRYLVPVILIILGVLDFIKTIAADDDGEIKKAGARFVKRLIAAALVFIVPLILQFILGMFNLPGLDPNNPFCILN